MSRFRGARITNEAVRGTESELGSVDVLINNAGYFDAPTFAPAVFLASDEASAIIGTELVVDCGLMAGNTVMSREITLEDR